MTGSDGSLAAGDRLGPYEITALVGAGGMGEVYRATDTRLNRTVAVKVLAGGLRDRARRRQRLEREARAVSALSHPHICALYDVGDENGVLFLVMEYVAGETLASRLQRGALSLDAVVQHATDVADALDHAHRLGVVHRDLKPSNIMLSPTGVKLLDFGLAKWHETDPQDPEAPVSDRPPDTESLTDEGALLGTLPYMSPEQLDTGDADARSDIFALGAIIYEMATARRAFNGTGRAGLMLSILEHDPPALATQSLARSRAGFDRVSLPLFEHVVFRCLAKQPEERWQTAADLTRELRWIGRERHITDPPGGRRHRWRVGAIAATGVVGLIGSLAWFALATTRTTPAQAIRFLVAPEAGTRFASGPAAPQMAVSPDGRWLAFTAGAAAQSGLWVRAVGDLTAHELPGTADARLPFWSPDSQAIGFFAQGRLRIVRLNGGPPTNLAAAPEPEGGAWGSRGDIVFAPVLEGNLLRVPAAGGEPVAVTALQESLGDRKHSWPSFLPDGRRFLYFVKSDRAERNGIYLQAVDGGEPAFVLATTQRAAYASGYLLFGVEDTLMAQPFDAVHGALAGEVQPVARGVAFNASGRMAFAASAAGTLVYRGGVQGGVPASTLQWVDRSTGAVLEPRSAAVALYSSIVSSPDGRTIAAVRAEGTTPTAPSLWLFGVAHGGLSRAFADRVNPVDAVWLPDGHAIAYSSRRESLNGDLVMQALDGAGGETSLLKGQGAKYPSSVSRQRPTILYGVLDNATAWDIWSLPLSGDRTPVPYLRTPFNEGGAQFSPDGRWVAYSSNERGMKDVYVGTYPPSATKILVSTNGGSEPLWRSDGREMYYVDGQYQLIAVEVQTDGTFTILRRHELFPIQVNPGLADHYVNQYAVSPDGRRVLVKIQQGLDSPITVVVNWTADLPTPGRR